MTTGRLGVQRATQVHLGEKRALQKEATVATILASPYPIICRRSRASFEFGIPDAYLGSAAVTEIGV